MVLIKNDICPTQSAKSEKKKKELKRSQSEEEPFIEGRTSAQPVLLAQSTQAL